MSAAPRRPGPGPTTGVPREVLGRRLERQLLGAEGASSTESVLDRLLAVQAQDQRGARLAVRARSTVRLAGDVDDALSHRRTAVVTWLNRGTLHLVRSDDYFWLHGLTAPPQRRRNQQRLRQEGVDPAAADRGIAAVVEAVATDGPRTRSELRAVLDAAKVPTAGQALIHVLFAASLDGHVVRAPLRGGEWAYVGVDHWLGPRPAPLDHADALARLARRYLEGHGPAAAPDLARWAGITLGHARAGFGAIDDDLVELGEGRFDLVAAPPSPRGTGRPRLLGSFDPLLHGWVDRTPVVGSHRQVVTSNGIFRPTALVGGKVVGTWTLPGDRIRLRTLEPVSARHRRALERDGARVLEFLGLPATGPGVSVLDEEPGWPSG